MLRQFENVGFGFVAAICWLGVLFCAHRLRTGGKNWAMVAMLLSFVFKGVTFTLGAPAVSSAVDTTVGVPNLCRLLVNSTGGVAWSAAILVALAFWREPAARARTMSLRYISI